MTAAADQYFDVTIMRPVDDEARRITRADRRPALGRVGAHGSDSRQVARAS
jgi:hypothetical protein